MFLAPLITKHIGNQEFELYSNLVYENDKFKITLMAGMKSDGASIPRALWTHVGCPMGGPYSRAAFLHDGLYRSHLFSKKECDQLFNEAMIADNVEIITRGLLFEGVSRLGGPSYANQKSIQEYRDMVHVIVKQP